MKIKLLILLLLTGCSSATQSDINDLRSEIHHLKNDAKVLKRSIYIELCMDKYEKCRDGGNSIGLCNYFSRGCHESFKD